MAILQTRRIFVGIAPSVVGCVTLAVLFWLWSLWNRHQLAQYDYNSVVYDLRPDERAYVTREEARTRANNFFALALFQCVLILLACTVKCRHVQTLNMRLKELHTRDATYLPALLQDGTIRLVDILWLQSAEGFKRRQDLPAEAFVSPESAARFFDAGQVAVLSYRWLPGNGSDTPDGFHLRALQGFCSSRYGRRYKAIFIDYLCLFQALGEYNDDRSEEELQKFKLALTVMMCLYASPLTVIIQHKDLPTSPNQGYDKPPYEKSGWCNMEQASATLATEVGSKIIRIGSQGVSRVCLDPLQPRPTPEKMTQFFQDHAQCNFFNPADRTDVARMYEDFYVKMIKFDTKYKPWIAYVGDWVMERIYTYTLHVFGNAPRAATHATNAIAVILFWVPAVCFADLLQVHLRINADWIESGIFGVVFFIFFFFPFSSRQWRRWMNYYLENLVGCHYKWESLPSPLGGDARINLSYAQERDVKAPGGHTVAGGYPVQV